MRNFFEKLNSSVDNVKNKPAIQRLNITSQVFWNLLLILFVLLIMLTLFAGGTGAGYFMSLIDDQEAYSQEEFQNEIYNYEEISGIYFSGGEFLGEIPAELERKELPLDEMSDHLINAVISTEDEYFFEHNGIVPKALLRATYQEVSNASTQTGGSTLTQQVVKNQILTNEVSFDRKAKEIALAMRMENYFNKEDILEAYLNIVPFGRNSDGRNIAGAQSAAEGIFGIDASELNPAQAAFIAGLPKNPYTYTPFAQGGTVKDSFKAGLNRMNLVLDNMRDNDFITEEEYKNAQDYNIRENLTEPTESVLDDYPYLTNETQSRAKRIIREDLLEEAGINLEELEEEERQSTRQQYDTQAGNELASGGYNVHITIKKDVYDAMQRAAANSEWYGPDRQGEDGMEPEQVGAMMIDNDSGAILSFVGGRDFNQENLNHATQSRRQNGSTMKPLLAYGPAMEQGLVQPGTILPDVPGEFNTGDEYKNYGGSYQGLVTVREGLKESRNSPAIHSFNRVDHDTARNTMLDLGFTNLAPAEPYPSAPIGAVGTTVEQNTNAYATFGNNGQYNDSYMIEKIETKDGEVIFEQTIEPEEVFSPQTTFLTIDMLRDVLESGGTGSAVPNMMNFGGDWAGKTGTTNDTHDSWFVGLNPNVTFGTWIGYDNPQGIEEYYKGLSYGARTQQIWSDMMNAAYEADADLFGTDDDFEQPDGIVRQTICGISGKLPSSKCEEADLTTTDYFNEQFIPTETDESLESEPFVTINGSRYLAYDSTPSAFTETGVSINEEYFDVEKVEDYLPDDLDNVTPDREAPNNGRTPSPVANVSYNGEEITWSEHRDSDIIGYRIYRSNGSPVGSVDENNHSFSIGGGSYFVTAVDSMGRESSKSTETESYVDEDNTLEEDEEEQDANNDNGSLEDDNTSNSDTDENADSENETDDNSSSEENNTENNSDDQQGNDSDEQDNNENGNSDNEENEDSAD
ncbi:penicillin-binding protein [Salibacterium salarium]|uniref:Penicillin-binding protein n=1 Tax=Salibacterium salarium TaxID=284579 RepID=A0A428N3P9_9BACI|nr:transglycosylase domain-containing protein [Salibacterium salarium]RSL32929.1 penicillin-binding protein [Salibacterium salarium]